MYFNMKNILKINCNHTLRRALDANKDLLYMIPKLKLSLRDGKLKGNSIRN